MGICYEKYSFKYWKKAYSLKPVVIVCHNELTDSVLDEIDVSLTSHELIKIHIRGGNKNERYNLCLKIQQKLKAELVPLIGFTKFYRVKPRK